MTSEKFQPIDTNLLLNTATGAARNIGLEPNVIQGNGYHQIRFPELQTTDLGGLIPQLWLKNRNDGATACSIALGLFRLICKNGLMVGVDAFQDRIIHVKGPRIDEFINTFEIAATKALGQIDTAIDVAREFSTLPILQTEAIQLIGNLDVLTTVKDRSIGALLTGARSAEETSTLWGIYNLVNEHNRLRATRGSEQYLSREESLLSDVQALYNDIRRVA